MSSGTSTKRQPDVPGTFQATHFYLIASMVAATGAVMTARNTHPAALLLLSAAVLAAGLVGFALHRSVAGFFGDQRAPVPNERLVEALTREKSLLLRSIKELEFDHAMGKVSEPDFKDLGGRLRARALALMQDIERAAQAPVPAPPIAAAPAVQPVCAACGATNDTDARFCKQCGAKI